MSRILAQSVIADLCGRLFNRLLFLLLLPVILLLALRPRGGAGASKRPHGDLKTGP